MEIVALSMAGPGGTARSGFVAFLVDDMPCLQAAAPWLLTDYACLDALAPFTQRGLTCLGPCTVVIERVVAMYCTYNTTSLDGTFKALAIPTWWSRPTVMCHCVGTSHLASCERLAPSC